MILPNPNPDPPDISELVYEWIVKNPILEKVRPADADAKATARLNASLVLNGSSSGGVHTNNNNNNGSKRNNSNGGKGTLTSMTSAASLGASGGGARALWTEGDPPLTESQARMIKRSYGLFPMLEHMTGLGNTDCIKKAIELYFCKSLLLVGVATLLPMH